MISLKTSVSFLDLYTPKFGGAAGGSAVERLTKRACSG
jgi:hypothetical protein